MGEKQLRTFDVEVVQRVRVTLDASKFTDEFMAEFERNFFPLEDVSSHAAHLAQLAARGVAELSQYMPSEFVEGYGPIGDMGISAAVTDCDMEIVSTPTPEPTP